MTTMCGWCITGNHDSCKPITGQWVCSCTAHEVKVEVEETDKDKEKEND